MRYYQHARYQHDTQMILGYISRVSWTGNCWKYQTSFWLEWNRLKLNRSKIELLFVKKGSLSSPVLTLECATALKRTGPCLGRPPGFIITAWLTSRDYGCGRAGVGWCTGATLLEVRGNFFFYLQLFRLHPCMQCLWRPSGNELVKNNSGPCICKSKPV